MKGIILGLLLSASLNAQQLIITPTHNTVEVSWWATYGQWTLETSNDGRKWSTQFRVNQTNYEGVVSVTLPHQGKMKLYRVSSPAPIEFLAYNTMQPNGSDITVPIRVLNLNSVSSMKFILYYDRGLTLTGIESSLALTTTPVAGGVMVECGRVSLPQDSVLLTAMFHVEQMGLDSVWVEPIEIYGPANAPRQWESHTVNDY